MNYVEGTFTQQEIESLFKRFKNLDRGHKGYLTAEEFLGIPELSINPIASRIVRTLESLNFKEFVKLLAPFSPNASREEKIAFMFLVYDTDGDGIISRDDMQIMLRQLAGSSVTDEDLQLVIDKALTQTDSPNGLDIAAFSRALSKADVSDMVVEIPVSW